MRSDELDTAKVERDLFVRVMRVSVCVAILFAGYDYLTSSLWLTMLDLAIIVLMGVCSWLYLILGKVEWAKLLMATSLIPFVLAFALMYHGFDGYAVFWLAALPFLGVVFETRGPTLLLLVLTLVSLGLVVWCHHTQWWPLPFLGPSYWYHGVVHVVTLSLVSWAFGTGLAQVREHALREQLSATHEIDAVNQQLRSAANQNEALVRELGGKVSQFEMILETTQAMMWSVDADLRVTSFNTRLARVIERALGFTIHEGVDALSIDLPSYPSSWWREHYERALSSSSMFVVSLQASHARRGPIHYAMTFSPIREGDVTHGVAVFARERTEEVLMRREQAAVQDRLNQGHKLESLGLMAGSFAHDFNNILTGILGELDLASLSLEERHYDELGGNLTRAMQATERCADLTRSLLDYAGKRPRRAEHFSMGALLEEVRELALSATARRVAIEWTPPTRSMSVLADRSQIQQVMLNLLVNAVDAIPSGASGDVQVDVYEAFLQTEDLLESRTLDALPPGHYICASVQDDGVGMDDATLKRLFEPFFTSKKKGRGLGLAVTLGIVRAHGGAIFVSSTPGEGTCFQVCLPDADMSLQEMPKPRRGGRFVFSSQPTILIIDDQAPVVAVSARMLESLGFRVLTANGGREGIATFLERPDEIDLVLLDVMMPNMNGDEVMRELRQARVDIPLLFMSGYTHEDLDWVWQSVDNLAFLPKPFSIHDLRTALHAISSLETNSWATGAPGTAPS